MRRVRLRGKGYVARAVEELVSTIRLSDNAMPSTPTLTALVKHSSTGWLRRYHFGEELQRVEGQIQSLVKESKPGAELPEIMPPMRPEDQPGAVCYRGTPELYLGYGRGRIGNSDVWPDKAVRYREELTERDGYAYLASDWLLGKESISRPEGASGESLLYLRYSAKEVNLVVYPPQQPPGNIELLQDGHPLPAETLAPTRGWRTGGASSRRSAANVHAGEQSRVRHARPLADDERRDRRTRTTFVTCAAWRRHDLGDIDST
jgi:hypothetical protein